MKILLSEAQIVQLLKEAYGKEAYIDALLDKMSGKGLSALTDKERGDLEKMSRGQDIEVGEPENEPEPLEIPGETVPAQDLFMELIPPHHQFLVDGERWHFAKEMEPHGEFDILLFADDAYIKSFMVQPFSTAREFKVITGIKNYRFVVKTTPRTPEEMKAFIKEFITNDLKKIVQYVKNKEIS